MNKQAWIALTAAGFTTVALQPIAIANTDQVPVITELPVVELPTRTALEQNLLEKNTSSTVPSIAALPVVTFNSIAANKNQVTTEFHHGQQDSTGIEPIESPDYLPEPSLILGHSGNKESRPTKTSELGPLDSPEPIEIAPLPPTQIISPPTGSVLQTQKGQASWYGYEAGNMTASGERYNSQALTAAHRTLSFNSRVRVTNTQNGKSVIVRINDRGPFIRGRIIDLSEAAAAAVGIKSSGVGNVQLEVLSYGSKGSKKRR